MLAGRCMHSVIGTVKDGTTTWHTIRTILLPGECMEMIRWRKKDSIGIWSCMTLLHIYLWPSQFCTNFVYCSLFVTIDVYLYFQIFIQVHVWILTTFNRIEMKGRWRGLWKPELVALRVHRFFDINRVIQMNEEPPDTVFLQTCFVPIQVGVELQS